MEYHLERSLEVIERVYTDFTDLLKNTDDTLILKNTYENISPTDEK